VVSVSPWVPTGGAAFVAPPWHELQLCPSTSSVPLMWFAALTVVPV
jgi:hypothetical protein